MPFSNAFKRTNNHNVNGDPTMGGGGGGGGGGVRRGNSMCRTASTDSSITAMSGVDTTTSTYTASSSVKAHQKSIKRPTHARGGECDTVKAMSDGDTNPYQQLHPPGMSSCSTSTGSTSTLQQQRLPRRFATVIPTSRQLNRSSHHDPNTPSNVYHHGSSSSSSINVRIPSEILTDSPPLKSRCSVISLDVSLDWDDAVEFDDDDDLDDIRDVYDVHNHAQLAPVANDFHNNRSNDSMKFSDVGQHSHSEISAPEVTSKFGDEGHHSHGEITVTSVTSKVSLPTAPQRGLQRQPSVRPLMHSLIQPQPTQLPPRQSPIEKIEKIVSKNDDDWRKQLHPFVSDIVFRSVIRKQHHLPSQSDGMNNDSDCGHDKNPNASSSNRRMDNANSHISFRPYTCQAAVLFVDLCGYSKITAAIAHHGAHFLSDTVNAYLSRLLSIISDYGGDVIKFAGDAIMIVWYGDEHELEINVLSAAMCATELQTKAGEHQVGAVEDNLSFQIHIGLCCGPLDSEVFEAPTNNNMQRLYHYVGGEAISEIGELVDLAKAGEICVSRNCFNFLENGGTYTEIEGPLGAKLLHSLDLDDPELFNLIRWHIGKSTADRKKLRIMSIEQDFIHNNVLANLSHGGFSPTQIAQMRNVCVLFIAMTSNGSSMNWLMEVQAILDTKRCPVVQIILDDKGVHVVAAVNLYEAIPEASVVGLEVCRELIDKRVGAAVGCAIGPTFCGVTGSAIACRWDITGPSVVRAARLMQYALSNNEHFALDQSLYDDPMAATRMKILNQSVAMKGTAEPIVVYTISDAKLFSAFRILENVHGSVHNNQVQEIQNYIDNRERSAVIVTGIPLAGMIIACQRAAGYSDFVPYLHLCEESAGFLQLARTIATWFQYVNDSEIKQLAKNVMADMSSGCWSCAHDQCVDLVNVAINKGHQACFVVDRIHYLDKFSISLIRECLRRPLNRSITSRSTSTETLRTTNSAESCSDIRMNGQICFLCTHLSLYSSKSAEDLVGDILRSNQTFKIPIVTLGESTKEDLRTMTREMIDIEVGERWLDAYAESSGYCAEYFLQRVETVRQITAVQWKTENTKRHAYFEISDDLVLHIPPGLVRKNKELRVMAVCPELAMTFSHVYDDFPPICQMIIKVITIATRRGFYKLPYGILRLAMNDLFDQGVDKELLDSLIEEMIELCIVKMEDRDDRTVGLDSIQLSSYDSTDEEKQEAQNVLSMQSPALEDITMDVCIPDQVRTIARVLIKHLSGIQRNAFQLSFTLASLHCLLSETTNVQRLWKNGYNDFMAVSADWPERRSNKWKEIIDDEIRHSGYNSQEILGPDFYVPLPPRSLISPCIALLKSYSAPIALGPMSQSLSILCRNTFYESKLCVGKLSPDTGKIRNAMNSASGRYMMQLSVVENYLRDRGFGAPGDEVQSEMEMISFIANPADSSEGVATKALLLLEEIVPRFIEHRLQRLYKLVRSVKDTNTGNTIDVFHGASLALQLSYEALQSDKSQMDAAQDALMILATMNWKPKFNVMEYIPLPQQHTVANIRDATLKRLSKVEGDMFRHRQNIDDLEAFLIVSALLENAAEIGLC